MEGACVGGLSCLPSINKVARVYVANGLRSSPYLHTIFGFRNSSKIMVFCKIKIQLLVEVKRIFVASSIGLGFSGGFCVRGLRKATMETSQFFTAIRILGRGI